MHCFAKRGCIRSTNSLNSLVHPYKVSIELGIITGENTHQALIVPMCGTFCQAGFDPNLPCSHLAPLLLLGNQVSSQYHDNFSDWICIVVYGSLGWRHVDCFVSLPALVGTLRNSFYICGTNNAICPWTLRSGSLMAPNMFRICRNNSVNKTQLSVTGPQ